MRQKHKPQILNHVYNKFEEKKFVKSEFKEYFRHDFTSKQMDGFIERYWKSGWLSSKRIKKGTTNRDSRTYRLSKKAINYLVKWGSFDVGPLVKKREAEIKYIEKEAEPVIIKKKYSEKWFPVGRE